MSKLKSFALILGVLIMSFLVGYLVLAWTEPAVGPPGGNVPAPLNVGGGAQTKTGTLSFPTFYDSNDNSWWVDPAGGAGGYSALFQGKVGIGTTTPAQRLHVVGNVRVTGLNACSDPITSKLYANASGDIICGVDQSGAAAGYWDFTAPDRLYPNNTAWNVGIGTTSPAQKLHVAGNLRVDGAIVAPEGTLRDDGGGWVRTYGNTGWYSQTYGGGWYMIDTTWIRSYGNKDIYVNKMVRADNGFQVDGYEMVGSNADMLYANRRNTGGGGIWISDDGGFYDYNNGYIDFRGSTGIRVLESDGTWGNNSIRANYLCMKDDCRDTWPSGGVGYWTQSGLNLYPNNTAWKVGIGTISPTYKLDVSGTIRAMDIFAAGGQNLIIGDDSYLTDIDVANTLGIYGMQNSDRAGIRLGSDGSLIFGDNGNVGIGTESPGEKLQVAGNIRVNSDVKLGGWIYMDGSDFKMGLNDGRSIGSKPNQRALVHDNSDVLVVNYAGDFEGGTRIDGITSLKPPYAYDVETGGWDIPESDGAGTYYNDPNLWKSITVTQNSLLMIWASGQINYRDDSVPFIQFAEPHSWGYYRITVGGTACSGSVRQHESPTAAGGGGRWADNFQTMCTYAVSPGTYTIRIQGSDRTGDGSARAVLGQRNLVIIAVNQ
ncbi:shufflon system plasmid conjugative transfer pilus tip adhesin PilV [Patescibacteria group bacterium]|nr:shufflon system plasmid conjugative transfer pilus tip adhesin PilV [Patescibacteria group bacterium]